MRNPFSSDFDIPIAYCERPMEFSYLCSAAYNGLNVILSGYKGLGKTFLIQKVIRAIASQVDGIYIPCWTAASLSSSKEFMSNSLAVNLLNAILMRYPESDSVIRERLIRFDPELTVSETGRLKIAFGSPKLKLSDALEIWDSEICDRNMPGLVVFDDFHLVLEKEVENQLRSIIQHDSRSAYVFVVNKQSEDWFAKVERPFFRSGSILELKVISKEHWISFLRKEFSLLDLQLGEEEIVEIIRVSNQHTATVMELCSIVVERSEGQKIRKEDIQLASNVLTRRHRVYISMLLNELSPNQKNVVLALAREGGAVKPYSNSFLEKHKLRSNSVQRAIPALIESELIVEHDDRTIEILDPVICNFLRNELLFSERRL